MEEQHRRQPGPGPTGWPRSRRLTKKADVQRVRSQGRSWTHPLLVLVACPNEMGYTRLGVTASRRLGKAVTRNRARRLLREAARLSYPHIHPGWDLLLIARPALVGARQPQVQGAFESLLRQAGLFKAGEISP